MPAPLLSVRLHPTLLALLDARCEREGQTRTQVVAAILGAELMGPIEDAPPVTRAPKAKAAPRKGVASPAPEAKPAAARAALEMAEARTGTPRAKLDTSSVPFLGNEKRPAYQKGQAGRGRR